MDDLVGFRTDGLPRGSPFHRDLVLLRYTVEDQNGLPAFDPELLALIQKMRGEGADKNTLVSLLVSQSGGAVLHPAYVEYLDEYVEAWRYALPCDTQLAIEEMLKENTGIHMMDSGGGGNRAWQRNQDRLFYAEPYATLKFHSYGPYTEIDYTVSLFWWLRDNVHYEHDKTLKYWKWCDKHGYGRDLEGMNMYLDKLERKNAKLRAKGRDNKYGRVYDSYQDPYITNTYNEETNLSQVMQYLNFDIHGGEEYALISIHGGADVRGGYTDCRFFTVTEEYGLHRLNEGTIYCDNGDCGTRWFYDGSCWAGEDYPSKSLEEYDTISIDDVEVGVEYDDTIIIDSDGTGSCPVCKTGRLTG